MGKKSAKRSPSKATSKSPTSKPKKPVAKKPPAKTPEVSEFLSGQDAAGKHWGVTPRTIQTWVKNGMPVSGSQRKQIFYIAECDPWVEAYRNERLDGDSLKLNEELKREKLKQEVLKSKELERKDLIAEGELVSREEYDLFAAECVIEARDQFLTIPKEMRRHLCKKCQPKVNEMLKMIEQTLQRLAVIEEGPNKQ